MSEHAPGLAECRNCDSNRSIGFRRLCIVHAHEAGQVLLEALRGVARWCHSGHGDFPASGCGLCKPVLAAILKTEGSK